MKMMAHIYPLILGIVCLHSGFPVWTNQTMLVDDHYQQIVTASDDSDMHMRVERPGVVLPNFTTLVIV